MAWNIEQFRADFPEFAHSSPEIFTDDLINFWAGLGDKLLNLERWGDIIDYGLELFVAHNVIMAYNNEVAVGSGDYSGQGVKPINSNSVGDVSVSYDLGHIMEENGGEWNSTIYGRKFLRLARLMGIGGVQL